MRRTLLLDNETIEGSILNTILLEAGFEVRVWSFPTTQAISIHYGNFDIAILDLSASMRNESQIVDLCSRLGSIPILIMTDNGTIDQTLRVTASSASIDYIKKPFSREEFLAAVERAIRRAELLRQNLWFREHEGTGLHLPE